MDVKQLKETLTPEEVELIRKETRMVGISHAHIASKWGIDVGHVRFIAKRNKK